MDACAARPGDGREVNKALGASGAAAGGAGGRLLLGRKPGPAAASTRTTNHLDRPRSTWAWLERFLHGLPRHRRPGRHPRPLLPRQPRRRLDPRGWISRPRFIRWEGNYSSLAGSRKETGRGLAVGSRRRKQGRRGARQALARRREARLDRLILKQSPALCSASKRGKGARITRPMRTLVAEGKKQRALEDGCRSISRRARAPRRLVVEAEGPSPSRRFGERLI